MSQSIVLLSVLFVAASSRNDKMTKTERAGEPSIYTTRSDDKEMNEVIAKSTLNQFDKARRDNKTNTRILALNLRFQTETGCEHIWATGIQIANGNYYGIIDYRPNAAMQVRLGERIKLNQDEILDWMYANNTSWWLYNSTDQKSNERSRAKAI